MRAGLLNTHGTGHTIILADAGRPGPVGREDVALLLGYFVAYENDECDRFGGRLPTSNLGCVASRLQR